MLIYDDYWKKNGSSLDAPLFIICGTTSSAHPLTRLEECTAPPAASRTALASTTPSTTNVLILLLYLCTVVPPYQCTRAHKRAQGGCRWRGARAGRLQPRRSRIRTRSSTRRHHCGSRTSILRRLPTIRAEGLLHPFQPGASDSPGALGRSETTDSD